MVRNPDQFVVVDEQALVEQGRHTTMKATPNDLIRTLVDVTADFSDRVIPAGTEGVVVEAYDTPKEGYAVDLAIEDDSLVGGYDQENVVLYPEQFTVVDTVAGDGWSDPDG